MAAPEFHPSVKEFRPGGGGGGGAGLTSSDGGGGGVSSSVGSGGGISSLQAPSSPFIPTKFNPNASTYSSPHGGKSKGAPARGVGEDSFRLAEQVNTDESVRVEDDVAIAATGPSSDPEPRQSIPGADGGGGGGGGRGRNDDVAAAPSGTGPLPTINVPENMVPVFRNGCMFFVPAANHEDEEASFAGQGSTAHNLSHGYLRPVALATVPTRRTLRTQFLAEPLRLHYQQRAAKALLEVEPGDPRYKEIPLDYHSLHPLQSSAEVAAGKGWSGTGSLGYPQSLYKVVSSKDNLPYALRRVDGVRAASNDVAHSAVEMWSQAR